MCGKDKAGPCTHLSPAVAVIHGRKHKQGQHGGGGVRLARNHMLSDELIPMRQTRSNEVDQVAGQANARNLCRDRIVRRGWALCPDCVLIPACKRFIVSSQAIA